MHSKAPQSYLRALSVGLAGGIGGALLGALLVAGHGAVIHGIPLLVGWGLVTPAAMVLGVLCSLWVVWVHPGGALRHWTDLLSSKRARLRVLLSAPTILAVWYLVGELAWRVLGAFESRPATGGVLIAASALGLFTFSAWVVDQVAVLLWPRLPAPSARVSLLVAALVLALGIAGLIGVGTTSGVGGPLALFGVFKRPELDLSPALQGLAVVLCAYGGAWLALRFNLRWPSVVLVVVFAAAGGALTVASQGQFKELLEAERAGGLLRPSLRLLRKVADRDGDGVASAFAGGDCNDRNAQVFPGAIDTPDNGIDEDCSGSDRTSTSPAESKTVEEPKVQAARLPTDANFLLLTIDTLRWDLGYTRTPRPARLSPHLDSLAERSTTFERAYALASYTSKSLGPMLIGRYPAETKRTFEHFDRFSPDVPFVQERLQKNGVHTASIQGYWYFFFEGYGFERGWDFLDKSAAPKHVAIEGDKTSNGDELADQTIEHLKTLKESKERFFMWTHWVDPHTEYVPHEEFDFGSEPRERYDGEVAFVDAQVGRVIESLKQLGLSESTIILVTSDHGEAFGEHGMIRHGFEVWEELARVPLILHVPGAPPRRVQERRSIIDVAPTIMETFDLKASEGEDFIRGTSLYRDALAPKDAQLEERPVLVDMPEGPHNQERRAFYSRDYKLIVSRGRVIGLYDLQRDPDEKKDLSEESPKLDEMKQAMDEFVDRLDQIPPTR